MHDAACALVAIVLSAVSMACSRRPNRFLPTEDRFGGFPVASSRTAGGRRLLSGRKDGVFGRQTRAGLRQQNSTTLSAPVFFETRMGTARSRNPRPGTHKRRNESDRPTQSLLYLSKRSMTVCSISSANARPIATPGKADQRRPPEGRFDSPTAKRWWSIRLSLPPFYFYGGYAVHGSGSVTPFPESHGCVRFGIGNGLPATKLESG